MGSSSIYPNEKDAHHAKTLGLDALSLEETTPALINDKISNRFQLTPSQLEQLGFTGDNTPNKTITNNPELYTFAESTLAPYPTTIHRMLLPNEQLANDLRKRYPPPPTPLPNEARLQRLIDSAETITTQKLLDYWIAAPHITPAMIREDVRDLVTAYKTTRTPAAYEALFNATKPHIREFSGPHNPIICAPALNKANLDDHLKTIVPSRIRKHLYKEKGSDYLTWIEKESMREPEYRTQLQAMLMIQEMETEYLSVTRRDLR